MTYEYQVKTNDEYWMCLDWCEDDEDERLELLREAFYKGVNEHLHNIRLVHYDNGDNETILAMAHT